MLPQRDPQTQDDEESQEFTPQAKKRKTFDPREFRKQIHTQERSTALREFCTLLESPSNRDYVGEYLDSGGNCLELLQIIDSKGPVDAVQVFTAVTRVILRIQASYPQHLNQAAEACRHILNSHLPTLNVMLGPRGASVERCMALKLLTAIATFSPSLAKDILTNVNLSDISMQLLTRDNAATSTGTVSVRECFIRFLAAFLVEGHYPTISIFLAKRFLLAGVISGLRTDAADTVCLLIEALHQNVLLNPAVSKTIKMRTFDTKIVKNMVQLYNWQGPSKNAVTAEDKSRVSECVHSFLLTLTSSPKHGIVFKEQSVTGPGANPLLEGVVKVLDRPWEHSYAGRLVQSICAATPSLARPIWGNLIQSLSPARPTMRWKRAVEFARTLSGHLAPSSCIGDDFSRVNQALTLLVAPAGVLRLIGEILDEEERTPIRFEVILLVKDLLGSIRRYVEHCGWREDVAKLCSGIVEKYFPNPWSLFKSHNDPDPGCEFNCTAVDVISATLDVFELFKALAPGAVNRYESFQFQIGSLRRLVNGNGDLIDDDNLKVRAISLLWHSDPPSFVDESNPMYDSVEILARNYYETKNPAAFEVLRMFLVNTSLFSDSGCAYEIDIWINSMLDMRQFDGSFAQVFVDLFKSAHLRLKALLQEQEKETPTPVIHENVDAANDMRNIETLLESDENFDLQAYQRVKKNKTTVSIALTFLPSYYSRPEFGVHIQTYLHSVYVNVFHCQVDPILLFNRLRDEPEASANFVEYFHCWSCTGTGTGGELISLKKYNSKHDILPELSQLFLSDSSDSIEAFLKENGAFMETVPGLKLAALRMIIFYVTQLVLSGNLDETYTLNGLTIVKFFISDHFQTSFVPEIFSRPGLYQNFSLLHSKEDAKSYCTRLLFNIMGELKSNGVNYDDYVEDYKQEYLAALEKVLRKPEKYSKILASINESLDLFNYDDNDCLRIMTNVLFHKNNFACIVYFLNRLSLSNDHQLHVPALNESLMENLCNYWIDLFVYGSFDASPLSSALKSYLENHRYDSMDFVTDNFFVNLLIFKDYNKENVSLAVLLLRLKPELLEVVLKHIEAVTKKKGVFLSLLGLLLERCDEKVLKTCYDHFNESITKALTKPHKAGSYFHNFYKPLSLLIKKAMPMEVCLSYMDKVNKYETTAVFHTHLLVTVYTKCINNNLVSDKQLNNAILTLIHLNVALLKRKDQETTEIADLLRDFFSKLESIERTIDYNQTSGNETFKTYCKYCLKYGVSQWPVYAEILAVLLRLVHASLSSDDAAVLMEMLLVHSEFLDVLLDNRRESRAGVLDLFLVLCQNWPELISAKHLPMLLSSYGATTDPTDRIILRLLRMYESAGHLEKFVPPLWGRAAASHYSVRQDLQSALWRQPKVTDILDILQDNYIERTIVHHPLDLKLNNDDIDLKTEEGKVYDLSFLLPLFVSLLAPENYVPFYRFVRGGALALTVTALSCSDPEMRSTAYHVLQLLHGHLEASRGKESHLWLHLIKWICRGARRLSEAGKLSSIVTVFLARAVIILHRPLHPLYTPLGNYLFATRETPDLGTVPELYTFLFSSEVDHREQRRFLLEVIRDGCRTPGDWEVLERAMAPKLLMEMGACEAFGDEECRLMVAEVLLKVARGVPEIRRALRDRHSLTAYARHQVSAAVVAGAGTGDLRMEIKLRYSDILDALEEEL